MVKKSLVLLLILAFVFSVFAAGCGSKSSEPIKIGLFGPLSGSMSVAGTHQKDGAQYAVDEINAAGGVLGRQFQLIAEDTEGTPQNAVNIMNKFLYKDKVTVTMGSNNSPEVIAVLDLIQKAETPHITPSGVAMAITNSGNPWVFRITATDEIFAKTLVEYAVKKLNLKNIAVIYDTNDYGQGGMKLVGDDLKAVGVTPVVVEGYNKGTQDFGPQLLKCKDAKAEAIIVWGNYTEGAQLVKQFKQLAIPGKLLVSTGVTIGNFYELAADAANGIIGVSPGFHPDKNDPAIQDFIKKYTAKKGYAPDLNVVMAYDAVKTLAKAIENGKSAEKKAIRESLANLKDYKALSGKVSFNAKGDGGTEALLYTVENGKPKLIQ